MLLSFLETTATRRKKSSPAFQFYFPLGPEKHNNAPLVVLWGHCLWYCKAVQYKIQTLQKLLTKPSLTLHPEGTKNTQQVLNS